MKACLFVTIIAALAVEPTEGSASASNWASNGTPVALGGGIKFGINAIPNGVGGFYATWVDPRNGILGMEHDVYVQSLLPSGMPPSGWPINGAPVLVHERDQRSYSLALNSDGGVLVGWLDQRFDGGDGYLQRMDADGLRHAGWPESGVAAVTGPGDQGLIEMCSDGSGGAYLSWIAGEASPVQPRVKHVLPSGLIDPCQSRVMRVRHTLPPSTGPSSLPMAAVAAMFRGTSTKPTPRASLRARCTYSD
jgi:hypothetical protein